MGTHNQIAHISVSRTDIFVFEIQRKSVEN